MRTENSSSRIFIIIIALLLIANIATLTLLLTGKKDKSEHPSRMRAFLKTEAGFSEKQLQDFDSVRADYKAQAKILLSGMQNDKQANLKQLAGSDFGDSVLLHAATAAAADQQKVEMNMLEHLRRIRNLCTPAQRAVFDTGFYKILSKGAEEQKKKGN